MANKTKTLVLENVLLAMFVSVLVLLVLSQANPLFNYPSRDGGVFNYIGHLILNGKLPYLDAWDNKPIGIYYLNALGLWLGRETRWGIWLLEFSFLFGSSLLGFVLIRRIWPQSISAILSTICWLWGLSKILTGGNHTEEYSLLFSFLAMYLFWCSLQEPGKKIYDFIIGVSLAISFLFRPNNIGVQISILLTWSTILLSRKELKRLFNKMLIILSGVIAISVSVSIYLYDKNILFAMIEDSIIYNFSYNASGYKFFPWWSSIYKGFESLGWISWMAFAGYIVLIVVLVKARLFRQPANVFYLFMVIGWPVELIFSGLSGRGYAHYYISWLPIGALLTGQLFSWAIPKIFSRRINQILNQYTVLSFGIIIVLMLILFSGKFLEYYSSGMRIIFYRGTGIEKIHPVASYIRDHCDNDDTVLAWGGEAGINFMARRDSFTAFFEYPLFISSPILTKLEDGFISDLLTHPPEIIVDAYMDSPEELLSLNSVVRSQQIASGKLKDYSGAEKLNIVYNYVSTHYVLEATIDSHDIYRLNDP